jgi:hypothetical protein
VWAVAGVSLLSIFSAFAEETAAPDPAVRAWLEAKSMHVPVALPIVGAQRTEIALGRLTPDGLEAFPKSETADDGALFAAGRANAAADLATLTPRYVRDRRKVIQYAELTSTQPIVASAVLAPKFLDLFKSTLGDSVLVVVPSRYSAYVFPQLATHYREYYPLIFAAYEETAFPVSVEVFELSTKGIRAVGIFDRP